MNNAPKPQRDTKRDQLDLLPREEGMKRADDSTAGIAEHTARAIYSETQTKEARPEVMELITESVLTCPKCGFAKSETMPTDACLFFYECANCKTLLRPNSGDCCVFCSYGSVKCPPIQMEQGCCG